MTEVLPSSDNAGDDDADREAVEQERAKLREFVAGLSADDIKSGGWFTKLCTQALRSYAEKATWEYLQQKYQACPRTAPSGSSSSSR
ncbi:hypothetical protein [Streptomyces sp. NPDC054804]